MPSSHPLASTSDEKPVSCAVKTADILQSMIFSFSTKSPKVCETPEQVKMLLNYGVHDFCDYVRKVVENIPEVTITNCLKIANQINFKEEEDKYDLELFLNTYTNYLLECFIDGDYDKEQLDFSTQSTLKLKSILQYSGINKAMAFKKWLIQQWEILGGENVE